MILHYDFLANCLKKVIIDKTKFYTMTNEEIFQLKDFSFKEKNNCISVVASSVRHYLFFRLTLNRKFNLKEDNPAYFELIYCLTDLFFTKRYEKDEVLQTIDDIFAKNKLEINLEEFKTFFVDKTPFVILEDVLNNEINELYFSARYNIPTWLIRMWNKQYSKKECLKICKAINARHNIYCKKNNLFDVSKLDIDNNQDFIFDDKLNLYRYNGKASFKKIPYIKDHLIYETNYLNDLLLKKVPWHMQDTIVFYSQEKTSMFFEILATYNKENLLGFFSSDFTKLSKNLEYVRKNKTDKIFYEQCEISGVEARLPKKANIFYLLPESSNFSYYYISPEHIINFDNNKINEFIKKQKEMIQEASKNVEVDGYLVYFTYTLDKKENEKNIEEFLKNNVEFTLVEENTIFPTIKDNNFGYYAILKRIK